MVVGRREDRAARQRRQPSPGCEAARADLRASCRASSRRRRRAAAAVATPRVRYQVMSTVPENWIPFIPVHVPGDNREIQLQRAAMPRILDGDPEPAREGAAAHVAAAPGPRPHARAAYFVHEEEVPRAGTRVMQSYQRTRWTRRPGLHLAARAPADRPRRGLERPGLRSPGRQGWQGGLNLAKPFPRSCPPAAPPRSTLLPPGTIGRLWRSPGPSTRPGMSSPISRICSPRRARPARATRSPGSRHGARRSAWRPGWCWRICRCALPDGGAHPL